MANRISRTQRPDHNAVTSFWSFYLAMLVLGVVRSNAKQPSGETRGVRDSDALVGQRGSQTLAKSLMKDAVLEGNQGFPSRQISIAAQV